MDSNKIIRLIVGGFFFISALYVVLKQKTFSPLLGFMIFILLAYAMGYFFKKEKKLAEKGTVPLKGLSKKMIIIIVGALIFIIASPAIYNQYTLLDEKTTDIILRYVAGMAAFGIAFSLLSKPLQLNKPEYMFFIDKKGSILRFILLLSLTGVIMILLYKGLIWLI